MTNDKLEALSKYCAKLAVKIDMIRHDIDTLPNLFSAMIDHLDAVGDMLDKLSISIAEAAQAESTTVNPVEAPSLSLRDISPKGGDKEAGAKANRPQSGVPGITWNEERQRWHVFRYEGGKKLYVGRFADLEEAKAALKKAKTAAAKVTKTAKAPAKKPAETAKTAKTAKTAAKKVSK